MTRVRELAGDPARNAAALVEGFLEHDVVKRAVVTATAAVEYHRPDHCPGMEVAIWLARAWAMAGEDSGVDLSPMLAQWRAAAEMLDQAGDQPSPN
jgi:hypothetical protein